MATDSEKLILSISADVTQVKRALAKMSADTKTETDKMKDEFDSVGRSAKYMAANTNQAGQQMTASVRQTRAAVVNLTSQFNDITQQLASGTSPMTVMIQQGSQVTQALQAAGGGMKGLASTMLGAFTSMLSPINLVTMGLIAALGYAVQFFATSDKADKLKDALDAQKDAIDALNKAYGATNEQLDLQIEKSKILADYAGNRAKEQLGGIVEEQTGAAINFIETEVIANVDTSQLLDAERLATRMLVLAEKINKERMKPVNEQDFSLLQEWSREYANLTTITGALGAGFGKDTSVLGEFEQAIVKFSKSAADGKGDLHGLLEDLGAIRNTSIDPKLNTEIDKVMEAIKKGADAQVALDELMKTQQALTGFAGLLTDALKAQADALDTLNEAYNEHGDKIDLTAKKTKAMADAEAGAAADRLSAILKDAGTRYGEDLEQHIKVNVNLDDLLDQERLLKRINEIQKALNKERIKPIKEQDADLIKGLIAESEKLSTATGAMAAGFTKNSAALGVFENAILAFNASVAAGRPDFDTLLELLAEIRNSSIDEAVQAQADALMEEGKAGKEAQTALQGLNDTQRALHNSLVETTAILQTLLPAMTAVFGGEMLTMVTALVAKLGGIPGALLAIKMGLGDLGSMASDALTTTSNVMEFIKKKEGFSPKAYWDVNHWRVGWASDTYMIGETIKETTQSTAVTLEQANADLSRRVGEFAGGIRAALGADLWDTLDEGQKTALTSVAYNYGHLPPAIVRAIKDGDRGQVARAIASLTVNKERRREEAELYAKGGGSGDPLAVQDSITKQQESNELEQEKLKVLGAQNIEYDKKLAKQEADLKFLEMEAEARKAAAKEGRKLGPDELDDIRKQADAYGLLEAQQKAVKDAESTGDKQATALEKLNAMLAGTKEEIALKQKIVEINAQLNLSDDERALAILKVTEESAKLATVQKLLDQAQAAGIPVTAALRAEYEAMAQQLVDLAMKDKQLEFVQRDNTKATEERKKSIEKFQDAMTGMAKTALSGFINDLRNGVEAGEAFANMLDRVVDSLINMAIESLFSKELMGTLFSGLGGMIGGFPAAPAAPGILAHAGGTVGMIGHSDGRSFSAATWAGAPRFAKGGMAGLRPGEVPIIAHEGEVIIPRDIVQRNRGKMEGMLEEMYAQKGLWANAPRFATGGVVTMSTPAAGSKAVVGSTVDNSVHQQNSMTIDMAQTGAVAANSEDAKTFALKIQKMVQAEMVRESRPGGLLRQGRVG